MMISGFIHWRIQKQILKGAKPPFGGFAIASKPEIHLDLDGAWEPSTVYIVVTLFDFDRRPSGGLFTS